MRPTTRRATFPKNIAGTGESAVTFPTVDIASRKKNIATVRVYGLQSYCAVTWPLDSYRNRAAASRLWTLFLDANCGLAPAATRCRHIRGFPRATLRACYSALASLDTDEMRTDEFTGHPYDRPVPPCPSHFSLLTSHFSIPAPESTVVLGAYGYCRRRGFGTRTSRSCGRMKSTAGK